MKRLVLQTCLLLNATTACGGRESPANAPAPGSAAAPAKSVEASSPTPEPKPAPAPAADTGRPADDMARDALRKPQEVMDFFGVAPGSRVVELMAGRGYYVDLLSRRVGPEGRVWAHNSPFVLKRFAEKPITERLQNPALSNVTRLDTPLDAPALPADLDAVLIVLFYHDTFWQEVDRAAMNRAIFEALKPGGVFGVIDHSAKDGTGTAEVKRLHRIEESVVVQEIQAAGFQLAQSSDMLRNPEDDRSYMVFKPPAGRDRTDRFVLKFVKPGGS